MRQKRELFKLSLEDFSFWFVLTILKFSFILIEFCLLLAVSYCCDECTFSTKYSANLMVHKKSVRSILILTQWTLINLISDSLDAHNLFVLDLRQKLQQPKQQKSSCENNASDFEQNHLSLSSLFCRIQQIRQSQSTFEKNSRR